MRFALLLLLPLAACWRLEITDDAPSHQIHGDPDAYIPPDAPACSACTADQLCVEFFDGTCGFAGVKCMPKTAGCEPSIASCSAACEEAYCKPDNDIFQCQYRNGCNPDPHAFSCYGP